jgi:hypothetical protein
VLHNSSPGPATTCIGRWRSEKENLDLGAEEGGEGMTNLGWILEREGQARSCGT